MSVGVDSTGHNPKSPSFGGAMCGSYRRHTGHIHAPGPLDEAELGVDKARDVLHAPWSSHLDGDHSRWILCQIANPASNHQNGDSMRAVQ